MALLSRHSVHSTTNRRISSWELFYYTCLFILLVTMVQSCVAYGCTNGQEKGSNIAFHRFPHSRPEYLAKWVQAIKRKNWKPMKNSFICSAHFEKSSYRDRPGKQGCRLKNDSVPSIFDFPKHCKNLSQKENLQQNEKHLQFLAHL